MTELDGLVAVITGAAQGMGRAVANRFAEEGAILVLVDINHKKLQKVAAHILKKGHQVKEYPCDVSNEKQVDQLIGSVIASFKKIDILVNCAGILYPSRFSEISTEEWDKVLNTNLRGVFLFMRKVFPHMRDKGTGNIINFSSTAGLTVSTLGGAHYTASKHAVLGLTKAVAKEGAQYGIRVNAVCPGLINTNLVKEIVTDEDIPHIVKEFPISRLGRPEEVAELVLFLASEKSTYITGTSLKIDGGDLLL